MSTRAPQLAPIAVAALTALFGCGDAVAPESTLPVARAPRTFAEQASTGGVLFAHHCASCHGDAGLGTSRAPALVGIDSGALPQVPPADRQVRHIEFYTLADVDEFTAHHMPKNAPASLRPEQYWAILAFDLHENGIDLLPPIDDAEAATLTLPRP